MSQQKRPSFPPLKALRAFEAAARRGGFALGAEEIGVTASAVSHQIQNLERYLGVVLFRRHGGTATLTPAGSLYAKEIADAFGIIANATRQVAPHMQANELVVAAGPSFSSRWLQPRLSSFLEAHPEVGLHVTTLSDLAELETMRFDLAIAYRQPQTTAYEFEPLLSERLRPLCSPTLASSLAMREVIDLERATLIHSDNALGWAQYLRLIGHPYLKAFHELRIDRSAIAIDAAVKGAGFVLESDVLASKEIQNGSLICPFDGTEIEIENPSYYLVRSNSHHQRRQSELFGIWLEKMVGEYQREVQRFSKKRA